MSHQHGQPGPDEMRAMFERPSWEDRYGQDDRVWSGRANPQLIAEAADLTPGTALDIGCGEGGDALWLAERGWRVTGLDFSQAGLDRAADAARAAGLLDRTRWVRSDVRTWHPDGQQFDLVTSQYMHLLDGAMPGLVRRLADAVAPGGTLLVVGHHPDDVHTGARWSMPGVMFTPDELLPAVDPAEFDVTTEVRPREHVHDGKTVRVADSVLVALHRQR